MVTDGASVITHVSGSSISRNRYPLDHKWMRFLVHTFNNIMKCAIDNTNNNPILSKVVPHFLSVRRIVEDAKRGNWNLWLQNGYYLKQVVETRFGSHVLVAERFLKSSERVRDVRGRHNTRSCIQSYESLLKEPTMSGRKRFPSIEAVLYAFYSGYQVTVRFEASRAPAYICSFLK